MKEVPASHAWLPEGIKIAAESYGVSQATEGNLVVDQLEMDPSICISSMATGQNHSKIG